MLPNSLLIPTTDEVNQIMIYLFFCLFSSSFTYILPDKKFCQRSGKKVRIGW